jgi:hypothetical protein
VDKASEPAVRYDPADPQRFALSWAVDHSGGRWAAVAFLWLCLGGLVGFGLCVIGWQALRQLRDVRHAAERSDEVVLGIASYKELIVNGRHTGWVIELRWKDLQGREQRSKVQLRRKEQLLCNATRTRTVGLVSAHAPRRPIVLRSDLTPFRFSDGERETIVAQVAALTG